MNENKRQGETKTVDGDIVVTVFHCPIVKEQHDCSSARDTCEYLLWATNDYLICMKDDE